LLVGITSRLAGVTTAPAESLPTVPNHGLPIRPQDRFDLHWRDGPDSQLVGRTHQAVLHPKTVDRFNGPVSCDWQISVPTFERSQEKCVSRVLVAICSKQRTDALAQGLFIWFHWICSGSSSGSKVSTLVAPAPIPSLAGPLRRQSRRRLPSCKTHVGHITFDEEAPCLRETISLDCCGRALAAVTSIALAVGSQRVILLDEYLRPAWQLRRRAGLFPPCLSYRRPNSIQ